MSISGTVAGRYRIVRTIGHGGMGEVYEATDLQLERQVALKAILDDYRLDPTSRARFVREARALSKLEHPSICRIHDYVEAEGNDFLVLELIDGVSLREKLSDGLSAREVLRFAEQIADALIAAHAEGIVHRDLKPGNVIVTREGRAKILDFGLARSAAPIADEGGTAGIDVPFPEGDSSGDRTETANDPQQTRTSAPPAAGATITGPGSGDATSVTRIGHIVGTPLYMSPEQARGEALSPASDMFSLGLLVQEMATGRAAYAGFPREKLHRALIEARTGEVQGVDRHLKLLIERLTSLAPSRRPTAVYTAARLNWIRRKPQRRLRWAAVAAILAAALATGVKYTLDLRHERSIAEMRRGQAEDLIEFMIGDLHAKLEPVGRLDALSDVGDKTLDYFETIASEDRTPEDRERLSRAQFQIGNVRRALGDYEGALQAYTQSADLVRGLLDESPMDNRLQKQFGDARFGIGSIHWELGEMDKAEAEFVGYLENAQLLMERDPTDPVHQLELGYALTNLAAVHQANDELVEAQVRLENAAEIKRRLVEAHPEDSKHLESLANTLSWLGLVVDELGELDRATKTGEQAIVLRRRLAEGGKDADAERNLSIALHELGSRLERAGEDERARSAHVEDLAISRKLVQLDPLNVDWVRGLAVSRLSLGRQLTEHREFDGARVLLESGIRDLIPVLEVQEGGPQADRDLHLLKDALARLELGVGNPRAAIAELSTGELYESGRAKAEYWLLRGRILAALGRGDESKACWKSAERELKPRMSAETRNADRAIWVELLVLQGQFESVRSELTQLRRRGYGRTSFWRGHSKYENR